MFKKPAPYKLDIIGLTEPFINRKSSQPLYITIVSHFVILSDDRVLQVQSTGCQVTIAASLTSDGEILSTGSFTGITCVSVVQFVLVFCVLLCSCLAKPQNKEPVPIITLENTVNFDGTYNYGWVYSLLSFKF